MENTHVITAYNKETKKREPVSMASTLWACKESLDFYKQQFKWMYKIFKVHKV